ncbi:MULTISPECIES: DUF7511 domain-containing protein [Halomicrobium]|uniref:DUF7511 domain-containing protein n=2 Tax=Halomicrobium mukohataei TaxID=57705 RepID=C7P4J1_HALMD|nr:MULTISPECIES: hypothetical protein [Halomicrobium]ACV48013.1 conserved hypothetical protein [Halomicrobium mukohataei DSM 12286]QCD66450.1 hypothetical protein E5139_12625 [Halomicrobium mukohataei]QFR21255.1 hypothetical protein GBQ70_12635 [Halomicrobium sp. ZPS1]
MSLHGTRATACAGRSLALQATVVEYDDGPDRCTVSPRTVEEGERTTTWLSADQDVFEDLAAMR